MLALTERGLQRSNCELSPACAGGEREATTGEGALHTMYPGMQFGTLPSDMDGSHIIWGRETGEVPGGGEVRRKTSEADKEAGEGTARSFGVWGAQPGQQPGGAVIIHLQTTLSYE